MDKNDLGLDEVCDAIGYSATRVLAAWFANGYLYIPSKFRTDHPLVLLIGEPALKALVAKWPSERVSVPAGSSDGVHRRDRTVAEMLSAGASPEAVAGFLELSPRRIALIRSELEARGILAYAGGYRNRYAGRPVGGALQTPDLTIR